MEKHLFSSTNSNWVISPRTIWMGFNRFIYFLETNTNGKNENNKENKKYTTKYNIKRVHYVENQEVNIIFFVIQEMITKWIKTCLLSSANKLRFVERCLHSKKATLNFPFFLNKTPLFKKVGKPPKTFSDSHLRLMFRRRICEIYYPEQ